MWVADAKKAKTNDDSLAAAPPAAEPVPSADAVADSKQAAVAATASLSADVTSDYQALGALPSKGPLESSEEKAVSSEQ